MSTIKSLLVGCVMSASVYAHAGDTFNMKYGLAVFQKGEAEYASFGLQKRLFKSLYHQVEGGLWVDRHRSNSGYGAYSLGMHLESGMFYGETMHGIGFITNPDRLLGGPFQFFHDLGVGIISSDGSTFGVQIKHVSSAGIETPNIGRNFISIKAGFAL